MHNSDTQLWSKVTCRLSAGGPSFLRVTHGERNCNHYASVNSTFCVVTFWQETACVSKAWEWPPRQCKICKCPTPGTDKAGKKRGGWPYCIWREYFLVSCSLRKHPFLLAPRRWGRFARRNVCDSATEIPYWWRKICPESGQKRWLVDGVVALF